jgi:hypothetical protein
VTCARQLGSQIFSAKPHLILGQLAENLDKLTPCLVVTGRVDQDLAQHGLRRPCALAIIDKIEDVNYQATQQPAEFRVTDFDTSCDPPLVSKMAE